MIVFALLDDGDSEINPSSTFILSSTFATKICNSIQQIYFKLEPLITVFVFNISTICCEPLKVPVPPNRISSVIELPNDTEVPLIVIDEFVN